MTKEHRYVFDVEDISGLALVCRKCETEVVYRIDGKYFPADHCVGCDARLGMPAIADGEDPSFDLLRNIRRVAKLDNPVVKLRFIVKGEK